MPRAGPQPIRYFSDELDGLHGQLIAPDFISFVTAYTRLGCAGSSQDEWVRFLGSADGTRHYLDADSLGAKRWMAWLARDPDARGPNDPPRPVKAETVVDYTLLAGAKAGSAPTVEVATKAGAAPDCIDTRMPNADGIYDIGFETAFVYAVRRGDLATMEQLRQAGAALDTRLLSVSEAIRSRAPGAVETVRWLLGRGARANGWTGDRYWPLHYLITDGSEPPKHSTQDYIAILTLLLDGGADPDARWDNGLTMLMYSGPKTMAVLLDHGADPNLRDTEGETALHKCHDVEAARLLLAHGAKVDAMTQPPKPTDGAFALPPHTPYQAVLSFPRENYHGVLAVLVAAGANPVARDGAGRSTLWYCHTLADAQRHAALGLDPKERGPDGSTLIHGLVRWFGGGIASGEGLALLKWMLAQGVDINAAGADGETPLHVAASRSDDEAITALLENGADKSRRDAKGRLPYDLVRRSDTAGRALLRV